MGLLFEFAMMLAALVAAIFIFLKSPIAVGILSVIIFVIFYVVMPAMDPHAPRFGDQAPVDQVESTPVPNAGPTPMPVRKAQSIRVERATAVP